MSRKTECYIVIYNLKTKQLYKIENTENKSLHRKGKGS